MTCSANSAERFAWQLGQKLRVRQEKASRCSARQSGQRIGRRDDLAQRSFPRLVAFLVLPDGFDRNDERIEVMFDVDQGVALIDMKRKTWSRLLFCGPSCSFQDAAWLDADTIAIVGVESHELGKREEPCSQELPCVASATATITDLKLGRMRAFQGPETQEPVATDDYLARRLSSLGVRVTQP